MNKIRLLCKNCLQCHNEFYTTQKDKDIFCPFCGFSFKKVNNGKRKCFRQPVEQKCVIQADSFGEISATVFNLSKGGVGIKKMGGVFPFNKLDIIDIQIKTLDINNLTQVVWINNNIGSGANSGLSFL